MESGEAWGILGGLESTPKEVLQNFLEGSATSCGGSNPLTPPRQIQPCQYNFTLTPGLYPGPGDYAGPGFYQYTPSHQFSVYKTFDVLIVPRKPF